MQGGLISDGIVAQDIQQASSVWRLREVWSLIDSAAQNYAKVIYFIIIISNIALIVRACRRQLFNFIPDNRLLFNLERFAKCLFYQLFDIRCALILLNLFKCQTLQSDFFPKKF